MWLIQDMWTMGIQARLEKMEKELIYELKSDMADGLTQYDIYVVRGDWNEALETAPIID